MQGLTATETQRDGALPDSNPGGTPPRIVMLAPLPPPITGAAGNNKRIADTLVASGARVIPVNTAAPGLSRSAGLRYHATRIARNIAATRALRSARDRESILYVQPDAGLGAWYTLAQIRLAGLSYRKFVFHHRSFAYVSKTLAPMRSIVALTRSRALHVFLSEQMARQFAERYGAVESAVITNACFVSREAFDERHATAIPAERDVITIGHLSNLRRNKGFFACADVFERLCESGYPARFFVAGPITEPEVAPRLAALVERWGDRVRHFGPVGGEEKAAFYRALDVFLFPTTHPQEAQPNVIYEALAAGVPVLATPRAAIPEMLGGANGACSPTEESFTDFAIEAIRAMAFTPDAIAERRRAIIARVRADAVRSQHGFLALMEQLGIPRAEVVPPWT